MPGLLIAGSRLDGPAGDPARAILVDPNRVFLASVFLRLEVMPKAAWSRHQLEVEFHETFFARVAAWAELLDRVVLEAERLGAGHGLPAPDALHVAAALLLGADELATTEGSRKPIDRVEGIRVVAV